MNKSNEVQYNRAYNIARELNKYELELFGGNERRTIVVGDFNNNVSDIIALNINPAILASTSTLFNLYNSNIKVDVHPTGWA